jgi:hypothetical protein
MPVIGGLVAAALRTLDANGPLAIRLVSVGSISFCYLIGRYMSWSRAFGMLYLRGIVAIEAVKLLWLEAFI